jgi:hypothetical protein
MLHRQAIRLPDVMYDAARCYYAARGVYPAGYRCSAHTLRFVVWALHVRCGTDPPRDLNPDTARYHGLPFEIDNRKSFGDFDLIPTGCIVG